jgi:hypothetical protein
VQLWHAIGWKYSTDGNLVLPDKHNTPDNNNIGKCDMVSLKKIFYNAEKLMSMKRK